MRLLRARCMGIEFEHENRNFFILRLDVGAIGDGDNEGGELARAHLLKWPRESDLAKKILADPDSIFVMACQQVTVKNQWLITVFPDNGDGKLGAALASSSAP